MAIAGTELSAGCYPNNTVSGPGVRPANANGFWACISAWPTWGSMPQPSCQTWTFDPSQSFTAQLKGMLSLRACYPPSNRCETVKVSGTLQISS